MQMRRVRFTVQSDQHPSSVLACQFMEWLPRGKQFGVKTQHGQGGFRLDPLSLGVEASGSDIGPPNASHAASVTLNCYQ